MKSLKRLAAGVLLASLATAAGAQAGNVYQAPKMGTPGTECAKMGFHHHFLWQGECHPS